MQYNVRQKHDDNDDEKTFDIQPTTTISNTKGNFASTMTKSALKPSKLPLKPSTKSSTRSSTTLFARPSTKLLKKPFKKPSKKISKKPSKNVSTKPPSKSSGKPSKSSSKKSLKSSLKPEPAIKVIEIDSSSEYEDDFATYDPANENQNLLKKLTQTQTQTQQKTIERRYKNIIELDLTKSDDDDVNEIVDQEMKEDTEVTDTNINWWLKQRLSCMGNYLKFIINFVYDNVFFKENKTQKKKNTKTNHKFLSSNCI